MDSRIVSRLAPTPSGSLHLGNIFNFILTWWIVRDSKGRLGLRIDDFDPVRSQEKWIEGIFQTLAELGFDWDFGPEGVDDFYRSHSQNIKTEYYFEKLQGMREGLFACTCSNSLWKSQGHAGYPGTCLLKESEPKRGETRFRVALKENELSPDLSYAILWRIEDLPSYHLVSLIDDHDLGVNTLIRGEDLKDATAFQSLLAKKLEVHFPETALHHGLLKDDNQKKLSKSNHLSKLPEKKEIFSLFSNWAKIPKIEKLEDLLSLPHESFKGFLESSEKSS